VERFEPGYINLWLQLSLSSVANGLPTASNAASMRRFRLPAASWSRLGIP